MFSKSSFIHLRIPFSIFLMPIFLFAWASSGKVNILTGISLFLIWHLFIYPASNGFNSYYDRDENSIGGLKKPPKVTQDLYWLASLFDLAGIVWAFFLSLITGLGVLVYVLISRAYSHPLIRLKKYPWLSWAVIGFFQGAWVYGFSYITLSSELEVDKLIFGMVTSSVMLWGLYPITQVYQHEEDKKRGDDTLSIRLGVKGSFIFALFFLLISGGLLLTFLWMHIGIKEAMIGGVFLLPLGIFFSTWAIKVMRDPNNANFKGAMRLNGLSGLGLGLYFILLIITQNG